MGVFSELLMLVLVVLVLSCYGFAVLFTYWGCCGLFRCLFLRRRVYAFVAVVVCLVCFVDIFDLKTVVMILLWG